ncbi:unnamed protein product [Rhizophagus irregularis]|uniref:Uncharacterized protein n=1 Tax=Rhizophagus irregularis TaxID=588596 RepID=A0A916DYY8_9GLOM|nr:unnamed protein product [Rhizophagus irregularis]CAB5313065.1 unnamed protein product [Rhizophagus irregularis]CAB5322981.1 unnamed protein product [Rhizophagus irregularis]
MRYKTFRQLLKALRKSFDNPKNTTKKFSIQEENTLENILFPLIRYFFFYTSEQLQDHHQLYKKRHQHKTGSHNFGPNTFAQLSQTTGLRKKMECLSLKNQILNPTCFGLFLDSFIVETLI